MIPIGTELILSEIVYTPPKLERMNTWQPRIYAQNAGYTGTTVYMG